MTRFAVDTHKLDCTALARAMAAPQVGAFVSFEGWVRNNNEGHQVDALEYEVFHAMAQAEGEKILAEAFERYGLVDARAVHREGLLYIGDCAVWIGVTARHRGEAFDACRYIIDTIKHRLPVWKKEHYRDLPAQWVNCQHHSHAAPLTGTEIYARQMRLAEVGEAGQARLGAAHVIVVGAGGLGCAALSALAAAGVGTLGIVEHDVVQASNLHRQMLYTADDIGKPKAQRAAVRLAALNPLIRVNIHPEKLTGSNVDALLGSYDIVLDCTDNFPTKYLLSDAAMRLRKPVIQASIYRFEGQLLVIDPADDHGCLRCLFREPPAPGMVGDCAEVGVLGTVPATFGTLQANEAIKLILGLPVMRDLLLFDLLSLDKQTIKRRRRADCRCNHPELENEMPEIDYVVQTDDRMAALRSRFRLIDVREGWEVEALPVAGALHMPTSAFDLSVLDAPKDQPLLVICAKGVRSTAVTEYLRAQGWTQCYNLAGGVASLPQA